MPAIHTANKDLQQRIATEGQDAVNLEVVPDGDQHIEMVRRLPNTPSNCA